jgi:hypothetical protein
MWNPFRRKSAQEPFPRPEWPPIQDLDSIDLVGKRRDGGVDLAIVASQPIDDSGQTLECIRHKVRTYLAVIALEEFQAEMGHPPLENTTIIIACEHPIHPRAQGVIEECRAAAAAQGVRLEVRKAVGPTPAPAPEGNQLEQSIRPATDADLGCISAQEAAVLGILRAQYGEVQLRHTEDDLRLLQRLHDDSILRAGQENELECVGIVFGQVLAAQTPLRWITVEWQGERVLGLQYPNTTVTVLPGSMIAKRVNRGERIDFVSLFRSTVAQVEQMKDDPGYKR